jgi:superfamily II DNA or RNA helicase
MIIEMGNVHATVVHASPSERDWLNEYLAFPDEKARFRKLPPWKRGDSKVRMLEPSTSSFPAGFRDAVTKQAKADAIKVEWVDKRTCPAKVDPRADVSWLRDYQLEAINAPSERGVFWHVTGAGKTEIMVAKAEQLPIKWAVFTADATLLQQTAERFAKRTGEDVGFIGDGKFAPKRVTIAMFQTVYRKLLARDKATTEWLRGLDGVMVDECHQVPAGTFYRVVMSTARAYYRYGFSGTPFARGDKKSIFLWGSIGPVIHRVTAERLIEAGVLAQPTIRMVPVRQRSLGTTWASVYRESVSQSALRNDTLIRIAKRADKPCFLFVKEISHGKHLERELRAAGEKVEFVWGDKDTPQRKAALRRLAHGDTDILVCSVVFQQGVDIPELQSVIIGSAGKSTIMALQSLGRGTRRHDAQGRVTKDKFDVWDIKDVGCGCTGHGKHAGCRWLEKHTRGRMHAYSIEKFDIQETII